MLFAPTGGAAFPAAPASTRPDVVLVTIDTFRQDEPGCYGGPAKTPVLDGVARSGVRFEHALAPVPLTLPAHASLLTGLDPDEHGLRENGVRALPAAAPTLAQAFRDAGYATVAVVGSRVLDRRFGLDRGFDSYDDRMAAERLGEFGYAERPAPEVVDAALAAIAPIPGDRPLFLWVHFYDPHAPYPPIGPDPRAGYRAEIELVDRELGRLLRAPRLSRPRWLAVVGDHGEAFGEHGETEHGYLLHEPTLGVPLVVAGPTPGAAKGVVRASVATRRLAATLARAASLAGASRFGEPLELRAETPATAIYHETEFPATTFGWHPLAAVTLGRWRLVEGAKPALYDLEKDPGETTDRLASEPERARELVRALRGFRKRKHLEPAELPRDANLSEALASLGYLSGGSAPSNALDPREGVLLLPEFAAAKADMQAGRDEAALERLRRLVAKSPASAPFLTQVARAEFRLRRYDAARRTLASALALQPQNEFLWAIVGDVERDAGNLAAGEAAYREAVRLSPRFASAWISLGELLARSGRPQEELATLRRAIAAECESAIVFARLAELELRGGDVAAADGHARRATELLPDWPPAWSLWAEVARRQGREDLARSREERARSGGR